MTESIFNRCGVGRLQDISSPECIDLVTKLDEEQKRFLAKEPLFRSKEYLWPRDALHNWSRIWEYPYVYHHLQEIRKGSPGDVRLQVADIGSGVTFFPLLVARSGCSVTCIDIDPVVARDIPRAAELLGVEGISVRTTDGNSLPMADAAVDVVYCISVLEHIPHPQTTVKEIARILKPGGWFILTIDLDLKGNAEIGPDLYKDLIRTLEAHFEPVYARDLVHPAELLTSSNGIYRLYPTGAALAIHRAKHVVKRLLGRPRTGLLTEAERLHLAVEGTLWRARPTA